MADITLDQLLQKYCDCARTTWNQYLLGDGADQKAADRFKEVQQLLFRAIVLDAIGMGDAERDSEDDPWPFLQVVAAGELPNAMVNRPSDDGNQYWERAGESVDLSDAEMQFVDLFDWDPLLFRDLALVLVFVARSPKSPELSGKFVLLERGSVTVLLGKDDRL